METLSIEQRIQILEDKEAIKDITYQYALHINQGWNGIAVKPNALSAIFTTNDIWESLIKVSDVVKALRITDCKKLTLTSQNIKSDNYDRRKI